MDLVSIILFTGDVMVAPFGLSHPSSDFSTVCAGAGLTLLMNNFFIAAFSADQLQYTHVVPISLSTLLLMCL